MENKFTPENAAVLLIDFQVGTIILAKNIPYAELNGGYNLKRRTIYWRKLCNERSKT